MMEKNFQRKIVSYIDGTLSKEDMAEFEAYVATHPEFEKEIVSKQEEIDFIKSKIPAAQLSREGHDAIAREMKSSIFNLLKEEPKSLFDSVRIRWEEWINR